MFASREEMLGYLAGIIDGEGGVYNGYPSRRLVRISNTDASIIEAVKIAFDSLDVTYSVSEEKTYKGNPLYRINVYHRDNFRKLANAINLRSDRKREALQSLPLTNGRDSATIAPCNLP